MALHLIISAKLADYCRETNTHRTENHNSDDALVSQKSRVMSLLDGTPTCSAKSKPLHNHGLPRCAAPLATAKPHRRTTQVHRGVAAWVGVTLAIALPQQAQAQAPPKSPPATAPAVAKSPIENLRRVSPQVYSGGEPHDDAAFSKIAELGIRTVVSVDGAKPDLAAAKKHGLRYIHIPIGYDGVDEQSQAALTRVMKDVKGPIFLHCHHGKHRGPAAAAVMCLAAGQIDHKSALDFLKAAGTGQEYQGLWHDVREFKPLPADAKLPELVDFAKVDSLAAAMATLDRAWDGVKLCQTAGWTTPKDHADLVPEREALMVWEGLKESRRTLDETDQQMVDWMDAAIADAEKLRQTLQPAHPEAAAKAFKQLEAACARCHEQYRN